MKPNIIGRVVENNICIGCGVCDVICPVDVLKMDFNTSGLYQPYESEGCLDKCTLCLDVCPFISDNENEYKIGKELYSKNTNIKHHKDLGYFINTFEIHKKNEIERLKSSSGGAGNWFQTLLLESDLVDYILTVESYSNSDKLFKFSVFTQSDELKNTRGSVYYPTEMSEVLDFVLKNDGRYAITAIPCFAKAIRLAQGKNHKLRKRIKYIIGLVCGQMKTKEFTHELARKAIGTDKLEYVKFRVKQEKETASNFVFKFKGLNGSVGKLNRTSKLDGPATFWDNRMFTPNACNNCIDTFVLCADIVLMDAWLPEYVHDYKGHTLVIVRTDEINNLIKESENISVKLIDYQKVYASQIGVVTNKHNYLYGNKNYLINKIVNYRKKIQQMSNNNYINNKEKIALLILKVERIEKFTKILNLPKRIGKKLFSIIKR